MPFIRQQSNQNQFDNSLKKKCHFCLNNISKVDYKDIELVKKFFSPYAKIFPRRKSGTCAKHQRIISQALKRARFMNLLPYVPSK